MVADVKGRRCRMRNRCGRAKTAQFAAAADRSATQALVDSDRRFGCTANPRIGVMLPYTPLHHLLLRDIGVPLVMTSGNQSDEPIAYREPDVFERLRGIADVFLIHNRPIHVRCDDSVTRVIGGIESPIRRSRGYAPLPIALPLSCPAPILAVGGQMKVTFALGCGSTCRAEPAHGRS